jgi:nitric oxide reductase NorD protein
LEPGQDFTHDSDSGARTRLAAYKVSAVRASSAVRAWFVLPTPLVLGTFFRVSPSLSLSESLLWFRCVVRLASADAGIANEFLRSGTETLVKTAPGIRRQLLVAILRMARGVRGDPVRNTVAAALAIVENGEATEFTVGILNGAVRISEWSFAHGCEVLLSIASLLQEMDRPGIPQRGLLQHALKLSEFVPAESAFELIEPIIELIRDAHSGGLRAEVMVRYDMLLTAAEELIEKDKRGGLNFFRSGVELLGLKDAPVIEEWIGLCKRQAELGIKAFSQFAVDTVDSTKELVALGLTEGSDASEKCVAVMNAAMLISERSVVAAAACYNSSPRLLAKMSITAYQEWIAYGLESFAGVDKLRAYFGGQSKSSHIAIKEAPDTLRLETVATVLAKYVRMLTGLELQVNAKDFDYDLYSPDAGGPSIELPTKIVGRGSPEDRFGLYKAWAALEAGYFEFGSYDVGTKGLQSLQRELQAQYPQPSRLKLDSRANGQTLIGLFPESDLARRMFAVVEHARIEHQVRRRYRGLCQLLDKAKRERRQSRPGGDYVLGYEPLLEELFVAAIGDGYDEGPANEQEMPGWREKIQDVLSTHINMDDAGVEDSIRACLELYNYLVPDDTARRGTESDYKTEGECVEDGLSGSQLEAAPVSNGQPKGFGVSERVEDEIAETTIEELEETPDHEIFYYDEWDSRIGDYRPRWCRVTETEWRQSDESFVRHAREEHTGLLTQVRDQFQRMRPVGFRRLRSRTDGDELDLEALLDHVVDRRARKNPSERIYSESRRQERDVAVCFLLDMSDSTTNRLRGNKHILDVEKEALLLMSEALEAIGDRYAIYGFSSEGRERVSFYRFKDFEERCTDEVQKRIGSARWLANTRLGAAIRHATWRINQQPSATRLLILLSDARPVDKGYPEGADDTRMALAEARASNVTPFCITFNQGIYEEEFASMFEDTGYTVIDDVMSLPERMPGIYRRLTS